MFSIQRVSDHVKKKTGKPLATTEPLWQVLKEFGDLVKENPDLAPALIGKLPDKATGSTAYNSKGLDDLVGGVFNANTVYREMLKVVDNDKRLNILDFGCGAARLLRYFLLFSPEHRYYACEVNKASLKHVRTLSKKVVARQVKSHPPSTFSNNSMDAVYAWSIWTHFDEKTGRAWLEDIHRILKPGGCALITVHSDELVGRYGTDPMLVNRMEEQGGNYQKIRDEYDTKGFSYWSAYPDDAKDVGIDTETFGMAFTSIDYIKKNWLDLFELEGVVTAIPQWQDLIVLKKR
ncbi:MAG: hypothetical protein COC12_00020 [Rhodobacteraceae bacterium]|nr:MAG: hypothetical protein COC12_00020 [Paracoccaceae bacterium]